MEETIQSIEQTESIELTKNSKGYGYVIKVRDRILNELTLKRLEDIETYLKNKYKSDI